MVVVLVELCSRSYVGEWSWVGGGVGFCSFCGYFGNGIVGLFGFGFFKRRVLRFFLGFEFGCWGLEFWVLGYVFFYFGC